jgi:hypothetical protein
MAQSQQPPSIGRLVHYTNLGDRDGKYPPTVQGALITGVNDDGTVSLKVFYKTGLFDCDNIAYTDEPAGSEGARGKWCWQAFVAPKPPAG